MTAVMDVEQLTAALATQATTVTQLTQLVTQLAATLTTAAETGRRGGDADAVPSSTTASKGTKSKKVFEQKSFNTLDKFGEGNAEQFQDWSYQVKMLTKSESEEFYSLILETERAKDEVVISDLEVQHVGDEIQPLIKQANTEFFQILATHLRGEALTLARGVQDMNGLEAWRLLVRRFEPSSK